MDHMHKALIFGISGQDGSYLAEFLLFKGYEVHGVVRRHHSGYGTLENIKHLLKDDKIYRKKLFLHSGDLTDSPSIFRLIAELKPEECYGLAAQADVQESFLMPEMTMDTNGNGVIRILEAIKQLSPKTKFYQASTSELFGNSGAPIQNESSLMNPQSPYAIGKLAGYMAVKRYREAYKIFACNGILFNHESERRGDDYVTRKITKGLARIKHGLQKELRLGNLDAIRDWGYSPNYIEAAWMILQAPFASDFVVGTGEIHTVREWLEYCLKYFGLTMNVVVIDQKLFRPAEVYNLQADYTKAKNAFGFEPRIKFEKLAEIMCQNDDYLASLEARSLGK